MGLATVSSSPSFSLLYSLFLFFFFFFHCISKYMSSYVLFLFVPCPLLSVCIYIYIYIYIYSLQFRWDSWVWYAFSWILLLLLVRLVQLWCDAFYCVLLYLHWLYTVAHISNKYLFWNIKFVLILLGLYTTHFDQICLIFFLSLCI